MKRFHSMMLLILITFFPICAAQSEARPTDPSSETAIVVDSGWIVVSYERIGSGTFQFDVTIDPERFTIRSVAGHHQIGAPMMMSVGMGMNTMSYASGYGAPLVPRVQIRFALPPGLLASDVVVDHSESHLMEGEYDLLPSNPRPGCGDGSSRPLYRDPDIYGSSGRHPGKLAQFGGVMVNSGVATTDILLFPVQYHPDLRKIEIFTRISIVMQCEAGVGDGDYISPHWHERRVKVAERDAKRGVINPDDVVVCTREEVLKASTAQDFR